MTVSFHRYGEYNGSSVYFPGENYLHCFHLILFDSIRGHRMLEEKVLLEFLNYRKQH